MGDLSGECQDDSQPNDTRHVPPRYKSGSVRGAGGRVMVVPGVRAEPMNRAAPTRACMKWEGKLLARLTLPGPSSGGVKHSVIFRRCDDPRP
jgi:hypothetical protein